MSTRTLLLVTLLVLSFHTTPAQTIPPPPPDQIEVPILRKTDSRCWNSWRRDLGSLVDEELFNQLSGKSAQEWSQRSNDRCNFLARLDVDFTRHSLLTYEVLGDCFVWATAKIFRSDVEKKYTIQVAQRSGICRAAGQFQSWMVVDKIPDDYKIEVVVHYSNDPPPREEVEQ